MHYLELWREITFATSCLHSCTSCCFWNWIYSNRKEFTFLVSRFLLLEKTPFWKGTKKDLTELPPLKVYYSPLVLYNQILDRSTAAFFCFVFFCQFLNDSSEINIYLKSKHWMTKILVLIYSSFWVSESTKVAKDFFFFFFFFFIIFFFFFFFFLKMIYYPFLFEEPHIWAMPWENFRAYCRQRRPRSTCMSAQSNQSLHCLLTES